MKIIQVGELDIYKGVDPFSEEGFKIFKEYVKQHNAFYYAREKEDFFIDEAIKSAEKMNASVLIVENLS